MVLKGLTEALNRSPIMPGDASLSGGYRKKIESDRDSSKDTEIFYSVPVDFISFRILLFDDNKIKMARKPGKEQKENPVGSTG